MLASPRGRPETRIFLTPTPVEVADCSDFADSLLLGICEIGVICDPGRRRNGASSKTGSLPHPIQYPCRVVVEDEPFCLLRESKAQKRLDVGGHPGDAGARPIGTPQDVRGKNAVLDERCREVGRDPRAVLRSHFTSWLMVAPTPEWARAKLDRYYPEGINEEQRFSRVVGTPDQVAGYYQSLVAVGMQYFVVQTLDATDTETIELLAREVIPAVVPRRSALRSRLPLAGDDLLDDAADQRAEEAGA